MKSDITIKEFKDVLNYILDNNKKLMDSGKNKITIEVIGEHGLGKTESIIQVANERNIDIIKINLTQVEEIGDITGFPVKEYLILNHQQELVWINEKLIETYLKMGYTLPDITESRMSYAVPAWVPKDNREKILLFDDFRRADPRYLQCLMELISKGEYISWKLPNNCTIVLSSNPDNGDYSVSSLDAAQRTRFISFGVKFDIHTWSKWAEEEGIDARIINFSMLYPEIFEDPLNSGVTPRTMVMFANAISGIEDFSKTDNLLLIDLISVGCFESKENVVGKYFTLFINNKLDKLITPESILLDDWRSVSSRLRNCVYNNDEYRADIGSMLTLRFINYIDIYFKKRNCDTQVVIDRILKIIESDKTLLTEDLIFKLIKTLISKYPQRCSKMLFNEKIKNSIIS